MRKFSDLSEREGGFTLIELLVVIIIIGILAAIAIPLFLDQRKLAVDAQTKSDVRGTVDNAVTALAVANGGAATVTVAQTPGTVLAVNGTAVSTATVSLAAGTDLSSVSGYNTGGKVYTGTGATFKYTAASGQFALSTSI